MTGTSTVKCKKRKEHKEKEKDFKEKEKDFKEKESKDIKDKDKDKEKEKEGKDIKDKEKEGKDIKDKDKEHKEHKDKESSKENKDFKEKEHDHPGGGGKFAEGGGFGGGSEALLASLIDRINALEAAQGGAGRVGTAQPFIAAQLRPDLSQSALYREEDLAQIQEEMEAGSAQAKRSYDTKASER